MAKDLGKELEASIKEIVNAMFDLLGTPNIPLHLPFPLPVPTICVDKLLYTSRISDRNLPKSMGNSLSEIVELTVVSHSLSHVSWHVDYDDWVTHILTTPHKG